MRITSNVRTGIVSGAGTNAPSSARVASSQGSRRQPSDVKLDVPGVSSRAGSSTSVRVPSASGAGTRTASNSRVVTVSGAGTRTASSARGVTVSGAGTRTASSARVGTASIPGTRTTSSARARASSPNAVRTTSNSRVGVSGMDPVPDSRVVSIAGTAQQSRVASKATSRVSSKVSRDRLQGAGSQVQIPQKKSDFLQPPGREPNQRYHSPVKFGSMTVEPPTPDKINTDFQNSSNITASPPSFLNANNLAKPCDDDLDASYFDANKIDSKPCPQSDPNSATCTKPKGYLTTPPTICSKNVYSTITKDPTATCVKDPTLTCTKDSASAFSQDPYVTCIKDEHMEYLMARAFEVDAEIKATTTPPRIQLNCKKKLFQTPDSSDKPCPPPGKSVEIKLLHFEVNIAASLE